MDNIPHGYCECGCGQQTRISNRTDRSKGWVRNKPIRYINGHQSRPLADYEEKDCGYTTPCWIWLRGLSRGYGRVVHEGKLIKAHRLYYEKQHGPVPQGLELDHLCRNKACVNPGHLEAVPHLENVRRGDQTKLTREDVRRIRKLYQDSLITNIQIAKAFGLHHTYVSSIVHRRVWADV